MKKGRAASFPLQRSLNSCSDSLGFQGKLYAPVDEVVRQYITMTSLLDFKYLNYTRPLLSPNAPNAIADYPLFYDYDR